MRVKPVPPPPADLDDVETAQRAVPLVPGSEADCCGRLMDALDLRSRDVARTWLTFLRGLGLVREGELGFVRTDIDPERATIADGLSAGVFGARELVENLGEDPRQTDEAVDAVLDAVPRWERDRDPGWRETWRTRAGHLLGWLVLAGLVDRVDGGYVRAADPSTSDPPQDD